MRDYEFEEIAITVMAVAILTHRDKGEAITDGTVKLAARVIGVSDTEVVNGSRPYKDWDS